MELDKSRRLTDEEYKFIFSRVPRLCLDFIIIKDNKIILSKRDIEPYKGFWHLPGGMVRYKESFDDAAERILQDELGVSSTNKELIGFIEFPEEVNENGLHVHSVSIVFKTKLDEGKIRGSKQAGEVDFFESLPEGVIPAQNKFLEEHWESIIS